MRTLGNILWHFPFFGFLFALTYLIAGALFCITIIGIPVGLGLFQYSKFLLSPFSNSMVEKANLVKIGAANTDSAGWQTFELISRILYFPLGLFAVVSMFFLAIGEMLTIVGIPSGMVWFKSLGTVFNPVNKVCVPVALADQANAAGAAGKNSYVQSTGQLVSEDEPQSCVRAAVADGQIVYDDSVNLFFAKVIDAIKNVKGASYVFVYSVVFPVLLFILIKFISTFDFTLSYDKSLVLLGLIRMVSMIPLVLTGIGVNLLKGYVNKKATVGLTVIQVAMGLMVGWIILLEMNELLKYSVFVVQDIYVIDSVIAILTCVMIMAGIIIIYLSKTITDVRNNALFLLLASILFSLLIKVMGISINVWAIGCVRLALFCAGSAIILTYLSDMTHSRKA